ncbi:MAG: helix-turn-helix transcriptional regulator, partial [Candidatus Dormibacteraeota bacterium]|nr:helix-turn-helix transcriptional regulator [Candidatus Dormibacteraeota bacterium]
ALARLERERLVTARLVLSRSGPARKYYRPTEAGYAALRAGASGWRALAEVVTPVLSAAVPAQPAPPNEED